jgi:hypothetical protein
MDQLEELFKQMQELAGVGLDMLQGAKGAADGPPKDGGGPPPPGGDGGPPDKGGDGGPPKEDGGGKPPPFGR